MINRFVYNYKGVVTSINDGRSFRSVLDLGFRQFSLRMVKLCNVELPGKKNDTSTEVTTKLAKAKECLTLALIGTENSTQGRKVLLCPRHPDKFGVSVYDVYVPCRRDNISFAFLSVFVLKQRFFSVNDYCRYIAETGYDTEQAKTIINSFELYDM